jgi:hypothetical protein
MFESNSTPGSLSMANPPSARQAILPTAPLLITESKDDFKRILDALTDEIKPRGIIEQMYVADIAHLVWEVWRLRRCKAGIINAAFRAALQTVLTQLMREPAQHACLVKDGAEKLARRWFSNPDAKKKIAGVLREFELDETAIEAEAIRESAEDLERIDRLLASSEVRRDKALFCVAQYRGDFGTLLRETSDRMIEGKVLELEPIVNEKQKPAA